MLLQLIARYRFRAFRDNGLPVESWNNSTVSGVSTTFLA
jgi:hypothetical protein